MRTAKTLIRLGRYPGWHESSLGAQSFCWFCHVAAHILLPVTDDFTNQISGRKRMTVEIISGPISTEVIWRGWCLNLRPLEWRGIANLLHTQLRCLAVPWACSHMHDCFRMQLVNFEEEKNGSYVQNYSTSWRWTCGMPAMSDLPLRESKFHWGRVVQQTSAPVPLKKYSNTDLLMKSKFL